MIIPSLLHDCVGLAAESTEFTAKSAMAGNPQYWGSRACGKPGCAARDGYILDVGTARSMEAMAKVEEAVKKVHDLRIRSMYRSGTGRPQSTCSTWPVRSPSTDLT